MHPSSAAWRREARAFHPLPVDFDAAYGRPLPSAAARAFHHLGEVDALEELDAWEAPLLAAAGRLLVLEQSCDDAGNLLPPGATAQRLQGAPAAWQQAVHAFLAETPPVVAQLLAARWSATVRAQRARRTGTPWWGPSAASLPGAE